VCPQTPESTSIVDAATRLRSAFAAQPLDTCVVKEAVRVYVAELRKMGATVERAIIEIRRIAEAALGPAEFRGKGIRTGRDANITDQAVTWGIDEYFKGN
jgi:hypothetical protein